jgi:hypothetical protein
MMPNTAGLSSRSEEKWESRFMELVEYKEKNGHCNCPTTNGGSLGYWIWKQRTLFRSKKTKEDRYEKLVGIGFIFEGKIFANSKRFETKSQREQWNRCFIELVKYKQKNGHCNCPTKNGSLGRWINRQRKLFKSKKLKEDRYEKLVGIGFALAVAGYVSEPIGAEGDERTLFQCVEDTSSWEMVRRQRWIYRHGILRSCLLLASMIKKV